MSPSGNDGFIEAATAAWVAWDRLANSLPTPVQQAYLIAELADRMSDLGSWLPGWDSETGSLPDTEGGGS